MEAVAHAPIFGPKNGGEGALIRVADAIVANSSESKVVVMGKFYTDEQIQEAIAALENYSPGIWENMKNSARIRDPLNEEQEKALTAIVRVLTIILPSVSFVAQAEDREEARTRLSLDLGRAVRAAIAAEDHPGNYGDSALN